MFKKFLGVLALVIAIPFAVAAQDNSVEVTAGLNHVVNSTAVTTQVEYRRTLTPRFEFKDAVEFVSFNTDAQSVSNRSIVRGYITKNVFAGGGLTVLKIKSVDTMLNPTLEAGAIFNIGKVEVEPRAQLDTPDVLSDKSLRSLAGIVKVRVPVNNKFGIVTFGGLRSSRVDNRFFTENFDSLQKIVAGGVYFKF